MVSSKLRIYVQDFINFTVQLVRFAIDSEFWI